MADEPTVLHPGDPEVQPLARAIASPTAGEILQALAQEPLTASALAHRLEMPITTAAYHLERLVDVGVIEVSGTRWSSKGREQKVYRLADRVVIVTPARDDLRSLLRKYVSLGLALGGAVLLAGLWEGRQAFAEISPAGRDSGAPVGAPMGLPGIAVPDRVAVYVLAGGLVVLLALIAYEALSRRRRST
ncbi:MAG: helix-turn-helix transcriptional regulator [Methanospirillum sp.]|nr:helix-turn-helix transcriptional regulator [Methanospirillum sp.]